MGTLGPKVVLPPLEREERGVDGIRRETDLDRASETGPSTGDRGALAGSGEGATSDDGTPSASRA